MFAVFSTWQHNTLYTVARPSVHLSVRTSLGWKRQKQLTLGLHNFNAEYPSDSSFLTINSTAKFQREHRVRGHQMRER